jgi:subtilisin family serine protease
MRFAFRLAVGTMVFGTACISLRPSVVDVTETDAELVASGAAPMPVVETYTASLALDRIAKRRPELDGFSRRTGTGRGVSIYVFDGGVSTIHPELKGRVRAGFDAYPSNPRVCNAHGTAVAGAAAGRTLGVAPAADVVDIKIINCLTKHGSAEAILAAARWVVADHVRHPDRPAVANWSFVVAPSDALETVNEAIEMLENAGILVVSAAGNVETDACRVSPASSGSTLVVGASALVRTDSVSFRDVRVAGTAWGRCVDVYAPGDSVLLPNLVDDAPTTALWSGTSMATGYVSGAAALVLEAMPSATPAQLTRVIERRATNDVVDSRVRGRGVKRGRMVYIGPIE